MTTERAMRLNAGKPKLSRVLCFGAALRAVAAVMEYGERKYAAYNFLKGIPFSESLDSAQRHALAIWEGEDVDPESGLPHAALFAWNALNLCQAMLTRPDLDDRPHKILGADPP